MDLYELAGIKKSQLPQDAFAALVDACLEMVEAGVVPTMSEYLAWDEEHRNAWRTARESPRQFQNRLPVAR